jgi:nucleotide-binding universal stress UspA family protein
VSFAFEQGGIVFTHILFPTDGSAASTAAARACIRFAAEAGARVTAVHVVPPMNLLTYEPAMTGEALEAYRRNRDARARECLEPVAQAARAAKVAFANVLLEGGDPYEAILAAARDHGCDLILMASHGRKGVRGLLLGSQTQKVLTHSSIPVMVFRGT